MSYYATINGTLNVQKGKTTELLDFVNKNDDIDFELWNWKNDEVGLNYYDNFRDDDFLEQINKLIPYLDLNQEQLLEAHGEDGSNWRYVIVDGEFVEQDGEIVYGEDEKEYYITISLQCQDCCTIRVVASSYEEAKGKAAVVFLEKLNELSYDIVCSDKKPEGVEHLYNEEGEEIDEDGEDDEYTEHIQQLIELAKVEPGDLTDEEKQELLDAGYDLYGEDD